MEEAKDKQLATRQSDLDAAVQYVQTHRYVLIQGPVGCGKTHLALSVARQCGRTKTPELAVIQMGEQIDAKSLLGSYHCTEVPGEFVWKAGILTNSAQTGGWLVCEDIQQSRPEVLALLQACVQGTLRLATNQLCNIHSQFRLIFTVRTDDVVCADGRISMYLEKFWVRIRLNAFSQQELIHAITNSYPALKSVSRKLVSVFESLCTAKCESMYSQNKRALVARDLFKWCARICEFCTLDDPIGVFLQACDVFIGCECTVERRLTLMQVMASALSVNLEQCSFYCLRHKATVNIENEKVTFGRFQLPRNQTTANCDIKQSNAAARFALTRPASELVQKIAGAIASSEPVLLVGETGTGKTAGVQFVAGTLNRPLKVLNLSQHSDTTDLLGGYRPVSMQRLLTPLRDQFLVLFAATYPDKKHVKFLGHVQTCFTTGRWSDMLSLMQHVVTQTNTKQQTNTQSSELAGWTSFGLRVSRVQRVLASNTNAEAMPFAFQQGILLHCVVNGDWLLLDEVNLANQDTLNCLHSLLEQTAHQDTALLHTDGGGEEEVIRVHPDFRLFACMNPATDAGKRNLPTGIRNRFTELYVDELSEREDLLTVCASYLQSVNMSAAVITSCVDFYLNVKELSKTLSSDAFGHRPHYSLRTLCRALTVAAQQIHGSSSRCLYEAFTLSFLTQLDTPSRQKVLSLLQSTFLGVNEQSVRQALGKALPQPDTQHKYVNIAGYWLQMGTQPIIEDASYVRTAQVNTNIKDVARIMSARTLPILLEGETSVGKTSLIKELARLTCNRCVRINNHEHTDMTEYVGVHTIDENGKLTFVEGPLVQAMRLGHWVILDELNLAPPEILEALNRLLDDNRELYISETDTTVRPHSAFRLVATQNPCGNALYGGRKQLSRAFANRFVQIHLQELPYDQLQIILRERCGLPQKYAEMMVHVMTQLQLYRSTSGVFAGKESYMTLRDLFRWGLRYVKKVDPNIDGYFDWQQYLADQGYLLLGGRCRGDQDLCKVQGVLETTFHRQIQPNMLFDTHSLYLPKQQLQTQDDSGLVLTRSMRRMLVLADQALQYDEPILLVGETGCGKTTACQTLSSIRGHPEAVPTLNCHLATEAADFLGRLRPTNS